MGVAAGQHGDGSVNGWRADGSGTVAAGSVWRWAWCAVGRCMLRPGVLLMGWGTGVREVRLELYGVQPMGRHHVHPMGIHITMVDPVPLAVSKGYILNMKSL